MIVVDANVVVYWAVAGAQTPQVERLRARDGDWRTVGLWRYEFASAMLKMVRAGMLDVTQAMDCLAKADALMTPRQHGVPQPEVLQAAIQYGISAYDAQYIALAQSLGTRCVTADIPLARKTADVSLLLSEVDQLSSENPDQ